MMFMPLFKSFKIFVFKPKRVGNKKREDKNVWMWNNHTFTIVCLFVFFFFHKNVWLWNKYIFLCNLFICFGHCDCNFGFTLSLSLSLSLFFPSYFMLQFCKQKLTTVQKI
jgi:hypothetical protein